MLEAEESARWWRLKGIELDGCEVIECEEESSKEVYEWKDSLRSLRLHGRGDGER